MDAAIGVRLDLIPLPSGAAEAIAAGQSSRVGDKIIELGITHLPYRFPEVFLRDNPGFDALIGNPPWEKIRHEPHQYWVIRDPGLRALKGQKRTSRIELLRRTRPQEREEEKREAESREVLKDLLSRGYKLQKSQHYDFAKVFAERNMTLLRRGGSLGIVLP